MSKESNIKLQEEDAQSINSTDSGYISGSENKDGHDNHSHNKSNSFNTDAQAKLETISSLIKRYHTNKERSSKYYLDDNNRAVAYNKDYIDDNMIIIYNQNICASIEESETTSLYRVFLSDEATENLVHLIDENNKYSRKYLTKDQEKSKSDIQVARIEASLKGFELDYHFKVEEQDKDQTILRSEIYKVMLELKGQKVPKSHYAKLLINKTIINLEQSNQYTDKQIEVFKKTIYQFDKIDKANNEISKFTEKEREELIKATENSAKAFSNELSNDSKYAIKYEIVKKNANSVIDNLLKEKKCKISEKEQKNIKDKLISSLIKFDQEYLENNSNSIAKSFTEELKKKGRVSWFFRKFTIKNDKLVKLVNDITGIRQKENDQLIKEKINKTIFSNALKDSDLTMKLTQFLNDNNLSYDSSLKANNHNIKNVDNDSLVELRKKNPKAFDKIFLLDQPNDVTLPSNGSKQLSKKQKGAAISI